MEDKSQIIDRIKKCLALGDSARNPNENEVANALAAAKRLMDLHNLSMAEVAATTVVTNDMIEHEMEERSGAPKWEYDLPWVCDGLFGSRHYTSVGFPEYKRKVVFYGYESDVALSVEVYKLLWMELMEMGRIWSYENPSPELSRKQQLVRRFKYIEGVVECLRRRAHEHYQGFSKQQTNALVVASDAKDKALKDWIALRRNLETARRRDTGLHNDAKDSGFADGKKLSMNFSKTVKGSKPLKLGYDGGKS